MKLIKNIALTAGLLALSLGAKAQQESSLLILKMPSDTRFAAMGNAVVGEATAMHLYTNPTSWLYQEERINVSAGFRGFGQNEEGQSIKLFGGSAALRLGNHGIFLGGRHWRGPKIARVNSDGVEGKPIPLNEATIDLGYALRMGEHFSAYASGSYVFSYYGKKTQTFVFDLGLYYRNKVWTLGRDIRYQLGTRLLNAGAQFRYGKDGRKVNVPASWDLGAELSTELSPELSCSLATGLQYSFLPIRARSLRGYLGGELSYRDFVKGRLGYSFSRDYPKLLTAGLSLNFRPIELGVAYQHASLGSLSNLAATLSLSF